MPDSNNEIANGFANTLNAHGYGFQYSILKFIEDLNSKHKCAWDFVATEFPVTVQGSGTRIDLVLKRRSENYASRKSLPFYLLGECKRANPALSNWCFAESPYVKAEYQHLNVILERAHFATAPFCSAYKWLASGHKSYHIAAEVKSNERGEGHTGRGAIEDAATQVCRGMNGMTNFCRDNLYLFGDSKTIDFLPVIFTTANLFVSDVKLEEAAMETGKADFDKATFTRCDWLFYQYHMSPGLKHKWPTNIDDDEKTLGEAMEDEYIRTIPIVSPSGLMSFLNWTATIELDWETHK